jgi:plastocyanin
MLSARILSLFLATVLTTSAFAQQTHQVDLAGTRFSPDVLVIDEGDTVLWNWVSGRHNVASDDGFWRSGDPVNAPSTFSITFDASFLAANPANGNVYDYHCEVHRSFGMTGSIQVNTGKPVLTVTGFVAGQTAILDVSGVAQGDVVGFAYSLAGPGPSTISIPGCGLSIVSLSQPITVLGTAIADASGHATRSARIPAGATGLSVWVQAAQLNACELSNGATLVVG